MQDLIDVLIDGVKKFGGEIIAAVLLAVALSYFPSLRKIFRKKDDSEEMKKLLEAIEARRQEEERLKEELKQHEEALKHTTPQEDAQKAEIQRQLELKLQEEERLKEELRQREEALKEAEAKRQEEARRREEIERQLKLSRRAWHKFSFLLVLVVFVFWGLMSSPNTTSSPTNAKAQYELGKKYFDAKNYSEAIKWYRKSAEQGYAQAQRNLGNMYYNGYGVKQDYSEAVKWFRKAAEQGNTDAKKVLELIDKKWWQF